MGSAIPQVITNRSGAQVIDGSLRFDNDKKNYLKRTPSSVGNRKTWTWSAWVKKGEVIASGAGRQRLFSARNSTTSSQTYIQFRDDNKLHVEGPEIDWLVTTPGVFRDTAWGHVVVAFDTTQATASNRVRVYWNGVEQTLSGTQPTQNYANGWINNTFVHSIGNEGGAVAEFFDGSITNTYFIDGQQLGPEEFGFTDPLTNTWKPKKYKVPLAVTQTVTPSYVSNNAVLDPTNAFDGSSATEATYQGVNSWLSFTVDASNLDVPFRIRNDSSGTGQTVAMFTDSSGSSAAGGTWASTGANTLSPAVSTTVDDTYTFPSAGTYYLRHTVGSDSNIFVYKIGGDVTTGANSFYLPLDGNSPIGQDKSGNGNDWTPVNFGGSVALDSPAVSGAKPILNTTQGGTQAGVGVFGSKQNVGYAVTVYNDGGGNKYYIDGVKQDTVTGLIRGATYTFDTSDSTVSSHPFRFSATSNGSHGGGSEYTSGVAAITGAATTITVPHDAPNTLYYYCTAHSGMGADITGITTNEKLADQYASNCTLAVPLVGSIDDVSASIACTSTTKAMTNNGSAVSSTNSNFYNGSWNFDASDDYLSTPDNDAFNFGSDDFTMECWFYQTGQAAWNYLMGQYTSVDNSYTTFYAFNSNKLYCYFYGSSTLVLQDPGTLEPNKWHHTAVSRSGDTFRLFIDGDIKASGTLSGALTNSVAAFTIGADAQSNYHFQGQIQDARVYKGVAKYTSDFVVPSRSPDVLPDTPSGVSGGSKLTKITDGAVSFEGTAKSKLRVNDSTDFTFGSNDFCIEFYYYNNAFDGTYNILFDCVDTSRSGIQIAIETDNDYRIEVGDGAGNWIWQSTGFPSKAKKWTHFALTRDGNTFRAYEDGVLLGTQTSSTAVGNPRGPAIGGQSVDDSTNYGFNGYISNLRIVNGSSVYNGLTISPLPTEPLTNITNTKLLCCQSNKSSAIAAASPNISGSINDGTAWSSIVTGPPRHQDRVSNAFDGTTSGPGAIPAYPGTLTFAPGLSSISSVKIYGYYAGSGVTLHVNGSQQSPSSGAFTLTISTSTLDSVVWTATNGFNYMRIDAIEVDSTVLIDPVVAIDDSNADATNFNPFNTDINTVRGQETGYPTWNPLSGQNIDLQDGNLDAESGTISSYATIPSTIPMTSGKWYAEFTYRENIDADGDGSNFFRFGISQTDRNFESGSDPLGTSKDFGWQGAGTLKSRTNGSASYTYTGNTVADGDILSLAFDADAGKLWIARNGTYATNSTGTGDPVNGNNPDYSSLTYSGGYVFVAGPYAGAASPANGGGRLSAALVANFGQKPFKFPPPDGFQPLNTANTRPVKVISRPDQYVGVTTYAGNGTSVVVSDYQFKPDLVWIKGYTDADRHGWYDSVRGVQKRLQPAYAYDQDTQNGVMSFDDRGFSVGNYSDSNGSNRGYVAWSWKAGGDKNTFNVDDVGYATAAAAGLTGGSYSLTGASVGTKQGFSIVQWTHSSGTAGTINHGLLEAPTFIIYKSSANDTRWTVGHNSLGWNTGLVLDVADAKLAGDPAYFNNTAPTSSVFSIGDTGQIGNGNTLAYLWHDVPGLQKFGSYDGNGGSDGPYVELGFRPTLLWIKNTDTGGEIWCVHDDQRDKFNPAKHRLTIDGDNAQDASQAARNKDFLSNGFKIRGASGEHNTDGDTYIYAAWAAAPSIDLFGGGANAR